MELERYQGMTLKDALSDISKETNENLYIGARTSFFLIKPPKVALDLLDEVSQYQINTMKYRMSKLDEKIAITKKPTRHDTLAVKKAYDDKISWFKQNKREIKKYLSEFVPFSDRKIIDAYERSLDGYALIVEGEEVGEYWLPEEFNGYFFKRSQKMQRL